MNPYLRLVRPEVAAMDAYTPIYPLDVLSARLGLPVAELVKLDANENPYGPAPRARRALAAAEGVHIYPDPSSSALRAGLAAYTGLPVEYLLCGSGADELLDLLVRLFIAPGQALVTCPPAFGMYKFLGAVAGATVLDVPRHPDFSLDTAGVERAVTHGARLIFVASPNNPDGGMLPDDDLRRLLGLPAIVVLDEAYAEFAGSSRIAWVREHANLAVLRTFSKWAGLAGLRVGYGGFPLWMAQHLWKIKQPYNVNVAASAAALASLDDLEWLQGNVTRLVAERERLRVSLAAFPYLEPLPSQANFVLCRVDEGRLGMSARALKQALECKGVLVRHFDQPGLRDWLRVSAGRPEDTDRLVETLQTLGMPG